MGVTRNLETDGIQHRVDTGHRVRFLNLHFVVEFTGSQVYIHCYETDRRISPRLFVVVSIGLD